jgi:hypothetical protein
LDQQAYLSRNLRFCNNALSSNGFAGGKRRSQNNARIIKRGTVDVIAVIRSYAGGRDEAECVPRRTRRR